MDEERFGFLDTDEAVPRQKRKADYERSVLGGCVAFSLAATAQLACIAVPLLVTRSIHTTDELFPVLVIYFVAASVLGAGFIIGAGLAGLSGSLAGLVPAATFLWLRLRDATTGIPGIEGMEPAEYPAAYAWAAPLILVLALAADFGAVYFVKSLIQGRARQ